MPIFAILDSPFLLANCSLLSSPYFAQNFASKFGQGLLTSLALQVAEEMRAKEELQSLTAMEVCS